jgi:murein DD-endopeptidase MepM/ murein hydrolase activator NlpD
MKNRHKILLITLAIIFLGFMFPQQFQMPVEGASQKDYNPKSFWYYPWGKSVTHKGVDIFAAEGTNLYPTTGGLVLYSGKIELGGNVILILGPKWRLHYYAHLQEVKAGRFSLVSKKDLIGTVGSSGNAAGKPPHLHYAVITIIPYFWKIDSSKQGWKKMFYLNPVEYLESID